MVQSINQQHQGHKKVYKLLLKAFPKATKKEWKVFTLRNVDPASITSRDDLKAEIRVQLCDDVKNDFDVGYVQGSNFISIRILLFKL